MYHRLSLCAVAAALLVVGSASLRSGELSARDWLQRGDAMMQRSRDTLDASCYGPAQAAYEQALALQPGLPAALLGLAWVANSRHDFAAGARWCRAALAVDEGLADAYSLLGDGAVELGNYDEAFDHCQRALDLRPDLASYSRAAHLLWLTGQPARGRDLMSAAIAAGGRHAENIAWCQAQLGTMRFWAGDITGAADVLEPALQDRPRNAHLLTAAARVDAARGNLTRAITRCEQAIRIAPMHETMADLVEYYTAARREREAADLITRVIAWHDRANHDHPHPHPRAESHPSGGDMAATPALVHGNAALALFLAEQDRDLDRALAEAAAAVATTPNIGAFEALAWCQLRSGDADAAAASIRQALRWNTPHPLLHYRAGKIFAATGDGARARKHLEIALALNARFHPRWADDAVRALARLP